ncbi:VOC family protein [Mycolicibacterium tusciae]|uniref:VOC family protein n=1 Tax=Mycolicibacterium tusciae TaxID=75922 RepID=UPI0002F2D7D6|nr:VOC family protein [Mycolicibacterium tusciae]
MTFAVDRIDHVVLNCHDVEQTVDWYVRVLGMRREVFGENRIALVFGDQKINVRPSGAPNWATGAVDAPGSLDLCFIAEMNPEDVGAHLRACGVPITEGPVAKTGAQGPMTSHYCRDPDGNLIEVASYRAPRLA